MAAFRSLEEYSGELLEEFGKGISSVLEDLRAAGQNLKKLGLGEFDTSP